MGMVEALVNVTDFLLSIAFFYIHAAKVLNVSPSHIDFL